MTRFRDLLLYDPSSTPGEEQRRASNGLANVVAQSHLRWWKGRKAEPLAPMYILLVVAPFSQYDLTLLDALDEGLKTHERLPPVYVANLLDYTSVEQLDADIPGITVADQTPILAFYFYGLPRTVACGKQAIDIAAQLIGLPKDELRRRIVAKSPSNVHSAAQEVAPVATASQVERWLERLGPGSRSFWRRAAEYLRDRGYFTFKELSQHFGVPEASLRSHHRNSYRAIHHERASDPLSAHRDERSGANVYRMPESVRDKILDLTENDPRE